MLLVKPSLSGVVQAAWGGLSRPPGNLTVNLEIWQLCGPVKQEQGSNQGTEDCQGMGHHEEDESRRRQGRKKSRHWGTPGPLTRRR